MESVRSMLLEPWFAFIDLALDAPSSIFVFAAVALVVVLLFTVV